MYENLIANCPKPLMTFKGFPHKENTNEFLTQKEYLDYLNNYVNHFNLRKYIKFNTFVSSVRICENLNE